MRVPFIGRQRELSLLDSLWESNNSTLLILYGRRRVGKTRLLTHWLQSHPHEGLYWVAEPTSALDQLRSFSQALHNHFSPDDPAPSEFTYATWEQAFGQVALMTQGRRFALFIDELPYLIDVTPEIVGTLQKVWDRRLKDSNLILALSGSQMGMMQKMLTYEAPLYGRASAQIELQQLPYGVTRDYFPTFNTRDRLTIYAMLGGVPAYWERLNKKASIQENIENILLPASSWLHDEPKLLLQDFVQDPYNYVGIMRAIAQGAETVARIVTRTGLPKGHVSRYLATLRDTGFVRRDVPVNEDPTKSRRSRYYLTDPFMRFHYRFLAHFQTKLAMGEQAEMMSTIAEGLPEFIERNTWRELCNEWVLRASSRGRLGYPIERVGGAWVRTTELDLVGIDEASKTMVIGCTLWREAKQDVTAIYQLLQNAVTVIPKDEAWQVHFALFASGGWAEDAMNNASGIVHGGQRNVAWTPATVELLSLEDVDRDLASWAE